MLEQTVSFFVSFLLGVLLVLVLSNTAPVGPVVTDWDSVASVSLPPVCHPLIPDQNSPHPAGLQYSFSLIPNGNDEKKAVFSEPMLFAGNFFGRPNPVCSQVFFEP